MRPHDLRPRLAALLAQPRVAVSLIALALMVVPLGVLSHGLDDPSRRDGLRLMARTPGVNTYAAQTTDADFNQGTFVAAAARSGSVVIDGVPGRRTVNKRVFEVGAWRSAWISPGQLFTELVPSWNALTPAGSWIQVFVQVRDNAGRVSGVKRFARWSTRDDVIRRASAATQADAIAAVDTDIVRARPGVRLAAYRVTVRLLRTPGRTGPKLRSIGAVASRLPTGTLPTSTPLSADPIALAVPRYSQMIHRGQHRQYDGGGAAWCSPTSIAMLLGYYGRLPKPAEYRWAARYREAWVNHTARQTYDTRYDGTGNWSFNTALAAARVGDAFVTRLPDLRAAERLVRAGIPIAVSVRFSRGGLTGSPLASTPGHVLVLVGFDSTGRPVVNDPAAATAAGVRRSYDRAQFERAWLMGSGGMAYVVRDAAHPLPTVG